MQRFSATVPQQASLTITNSFLLWWENCSSGQVAVGAILALGSEMAWVEELRGEVGWAMDG